MECMRVYLLRLLDLSVSQQHAPQEVYGDPAAEVEPGVDSLLPRLLHDAAPVNGLPVTSSPMAWWPEVPRPTQQKTERWRGGSRRRERPMGTTPDAR